MRVLKSNAHVDLSTGKRTDQLVGEGQVVDIYVADSTGVRDALIKHRNLQIRGTGRLDSFIGYQH